MPSEVYLLPQAQEDLNAVRDPLFSEIMGRIQWLRDYPFWGAPMDGPFMGYRSFVVGMFRVLYRIPSEKRIEIAYIRHCKRNPIFS